MDYSPEFTGRPPILLGPPFQYSLFPHLQPWPRWVLRLHHATHLHFDLRFEVLGKLLSFVLYEPPSLNPRKWVPAKRVSDHDLRYIAPERRIAFGLPGHGPTMPVDGWDYAPVRMRHSTFDEKMLAQFADGEIHLILKGRHLQGEWRLWGHGERWNFQKLPDEHASTTKILQLDRSILTGRTLGQIENRGPSPSARGLRP